MKIKHWYQSRTIWLSVTTLMSLISTVLLYVNELGLDGKTTAIISMSLSIVQIFGTVYLRFNTDHAIGKPEKPKEFTGG